MLDAVIVGSGGAGLSAALRLKEFSDNFLLITECNLGQSNTMMAQGGIQIALGAKDSIKKHFNDSFSGGNYKNDKELLLLMVSKGMEMLKWLNEMGMDFDKVNDKYDLKSCSGICEKRVLSKGTGIGRTILKMLIPKVKKNFIKINTKASLKSILREKDHFLLKTVNNKKDDWIKTKRVILCCGGRSKDYAKRHRLGTTNQHCSSFDFYPSLYRLNIKMRDKNSFQLHPACISLNGPLLGVPTPEPLLSLGGVFLDKKGRKIADSRLKRDLLSKKIMNVINNNMGVSVKLAYKSVYLDLREIFDTYSQVTLKPFTNFFKKLSRFGINPRVDKIPITPMVHYQNGGIVINTKCETSVQGIYAAGEITGGIHGTNRLMGNSLLDILVFGNIAGRSCGESIIKGG